MNPFFKCCILSATVIVAGANLSWAEPKGSVPLSGDKYKEISGYACGLIGAQWRAGTMVSPTHFLAFYTKSALLRQSASRKKGAAKKKALSDADIFKKKARVGDIACRSSTEAKKGLRFDFTGAVGVVVTSAASSDVAMSSDASNLKKVMSSGKLADVVTSGQAPVSNLYVAPNNKLYLVFKEQIDLVTGEPSPLNGCLLAEVDHETGVPSCIENELIAIGWNTARKPIQFDTDGNIYYLGTAIIRSGNASTAVDALRKYSHGATTSLITDSVRMLDFQVLDDGSIYLSGQTLNTQAYWVRQISAAGSIKNISTDGISPFIEQFPDGNIYFGRSRPNWGSGVSRYLVSSQQIDSKPWIAWAGGLGEPVYNDLSTFCSIGAEPYLAPFCQSYGISVKSFHHTLDGRVFAVASSNGPGPLLEYYPTLRNPATLVRKVTIARSILNSIVLAGLDSDSRNRLTLFDPGSGAELDLLPNDDVEVYTMSFLGDSNRLMFGGLRFSDNTYVLGSIDMATLEVTMTSTGSSRLVDFQTF